VLLTFPAEGILKNGCEYGPVGRKQDYEKWWRCIRILSQESNERQQRTYEDDFDRRHNCGYRALPGKLRFRSQEGFGRQIQHTRREEKEGKRKNEKEDNEFCPRNFHLHRYKALSQQETSTFHCKDTFAGNAPNPGRNSRSTRDVPLLAFLLNHGGFTSWQSWRLGRLLSR